MHHTIALKISRYGSMALSRTNRLRLNEKASKMGQVQRVSPAQYLMHCVEEQRTRFLGQGVYFARISTQSKHTRAAKLAFPDMI